MSKENLYTILLVEDDHIISMSQTRNINSLGYNVIQAYSGEQAIDLVIKNDSVDLILMDIDLGDGINGLETSRQILARKNLPIVFLSSHNEKEYQNLANSITGYGFIEKGSSDHVLKIVIEMSMKLFAAHEKAKNREIELLESQKQLRKKNKQMEFLAELALNIASRKHDDHLPDFLANQLKKVTKASFVTIQIYDPATKILKTKKILTDREMLTKIVNFLGEKIFTLEMPISEKSYDMIISEYIGEFSSLTELTFGVIPLNIDKIFKSQTKINRFYSLALIIDDQLYGTATFGLQKDTHNPSEEFLKSFAHIAAIALKRKLTEDELKKSAINYKNIVTSLNDAVFTVDDKGILRFITESIEQIMGYKSEEIIGRPFSDFTYPEDLPGLQIQFKETLQGELMPYEFRVIKKNNELLWIRTSSKPTSLGEPYNFNGLTGLLIGITKEKYAQEKIQNLLNEKVLLLKEVHHRIKNNMTMVSSLLNIQARNFKNQEVVEAFQSASKRVQSMMVLYDRLYRENNYLEFSVKTYFISLIAEIMPTLTTMCDIEIIQDIDDSILPVKTLTNLGILINEVLTNIVKHSSNITKKVVIHLNFLKGNNFNKLEILDNGSGLPEGFSFQNAESFGLQLIQILVQQINGEISYFKDDKNRITIEFPD